MATKLVKDLKQWDAFLEEGFTIRVIEKPQAVGENQIRLKVIGGTKGNDRIEPADRKVSLIKEEPRDTIPLAPVRRAATFRGRSIE